MRKIRFPKLSEDKWRKLSLILAVLLLVSIGVAIGLVLNNKQTAPTDSNLTSQPTKSTSKTKPDSDSRASTNAANSAGSSPAQASSTPKSAATTSPAPTQSTPAPATLPNCTYSNGPQAGQHCPQSPPSSYSYSNAYPYSCYMPDPSNPGYVTSYPGNCPPYEDVVSIVGTGSGASSDCQFNYSTYNGTSGIDKSDRVNNYGSGLPDCSTATLYY